MGFLHTNAGGRRLAGSKGGKKKGKDDDSFPDDRSVSSHTSLRSLRSLGSRASGKWFRNRLPGGGYKKTGDGDRAGDAAAVDRGRGALTETSSDDSSLTPPELRSEPPPEPRPDVPPPALRRSRPSADELADAYGFDEASVDDSLFSWVSSSSSESSDPKGRRRVSWNVPSFGRRAGTAREPAALQSFNSATSSVSDAGSVDPWSASSASNSNGDARPPPSDAAAPPPKARARICPVNTDDFIDDDPEDDRSAEEEEEEEDDDGDDDGDDDEGEEEPVSMMLVSFRTLVEGDDESASTNVSEISDALPDALPGDVQQKVPRDFVRNNEASVRDYERRLAVLARVHEASVRDYEAQIAQLREATASKDDGLKAALEALREENRVLREALRTAEEDERGWAKLVTEKKGEHRREVERLTREREEAQEACQGLIREVGLLRRGKPDCEEGGPRSMDDSFERVWRATDDAAADD